MALSTAICEATHLRQKIAELQQTPEEQTLILCDAEGSITLAHKETIGKLNKSVLPNIATSICRWSLNATPSSLFSLSLYCLHIT